MNDSTAGQESLSIFENMTYFISRILFILYMFRKEWGLYKLWIF